MKKYILYSTIALSLSSCCNKKPVFTKRYAKLTVETNSTIIKDSISIGGYIIEPTKESPPKATTIADLTDKGQAALITELAKKEAKTEDFLNATGSKIQSKSKENKEPIIDYTKITKQVVLTIQNKSHNPANRIAKINAILDLSSSDANIKLISCDKLVTTFGSIDLGKLNYSDVSVSELTGTASLGGGVEKNITEGTDTTKITSSNGLSATGKLSSTKTLAEEVLLKQRLVSLNASIDNNKLQLYQEGTTGIDLAGNVIATITFEVKNVAVQKVFSFSNLIDATTKKISDPKDIKMSSSLILYPNLTTGLNAKLGYEADFRYVVKNSETIVESDDEVKLYNGSFTHTNPVELVSKEKLIPKLWIIAQSDDKNFLPVQIQSVNSLVGGQLLFNSFEDAENFLAWIKFKYSTNATNSLSIVNNDYFVKMPSTFNDIKKLEIYPYK